MAKYKCNKLFQSKKWKKFLEGVFITPEESVNIRKAIEKLFETKETVTKEDILEIYKQEITWYGGDNERTNSSRKSS